MSGKYRGYSEYKDSEVEWLGAIPSHWARLPLKYMTGNKVKDGPHETPKFIDDGVPFLSVDGIQNNELVFDGCRYVSEEEHQRFSLKCRPTEGDVLLGKAASVGKVAYVDTSCEFNVWSPLAVITPKVKTSGRFIFYSIQSAALQAQCDLRSNSNTQKNLGMGDIDNLFFAAPNSAEQATIVDFLDHETAKIDTLIDKQQQLIKLLKEKRQTVISHAVAKGLNPAAPMKNSGVEWLGEVPEHWAVAKLSYRYEVLLGKMLDDKKITGAYLDKYLRNTDVQWDRINTEDLPEMDFRPEERERFSVKKGDLIVCEGGEIGRSAIWEKEESCFYQKALHRLRPVDSKKDNTRFMFYVLYDAVHQERFVSGAGKATIAHLPAETFKQFRFGFPPLREQLLIAKYLDGIKAKFDLVEQKANSQIALLQERRTALISAAVTGKIDVRNWQPAQPKIPMEASA